MIHYLNSPQEEVIKFKKFKISHILEFHFLEFKEIFSTIYLIGLACLILGIILFIISKKFKLKISFKSFNIFFYEVLFIFLSLILIF
ncbi:lipoprotein intramolecular transacylase Lit [Clostridium perfringens]